ncbi:MAG: hypothetical protein K0Q95_1771 [Bacteroidota bacterium]|jgi:hypothetical protein|nr:hypothetical protein [Bacteroidota bacterium]
MKLDFLDEVNEYGDQLIRLYEFDKDEAQKFRDAVQGNLVDNSISLDLTTLDFIEPVNCKVILHLADEDEGILTHDHKVFFCDLTKDGYRNMLRLIEPFCKKDTRRSQLLYDLDNPIDFLFAPFAASE